MYNIMNIFKKVLNFVVDKIEDINEILTDFFRRYRTFFTLIIFIINILTLGYLIYKLYYVVSLKE